MHFELQNISLLLFNTSWFPNPLHFFFSVSEDYHFYTDYWCIIFRYVYAEKNLLLENIHLKIKIFVQNIFQTWIERKPECCHINLLICRKGASFFLCVFKLWFFVVNRVHPDSIYIHCNGQLFLMLLTYLWT